MAEKYGLHNTNRQQRLADVLGAGTEMHQKDARRALDARRVGPFLHDSDQNGRTAELPDRRADPPPRLIVPRHLGELHQRGLDDVGVFPKQIVEEELLDLRGRRRRLLLLSPRLRGWRRGSSPVAAAAAAGLGILTSALLAPLSVPLVIVATVAVAGPVAVVVRHRRRDDLISHLSTVPTPLLIVVGAAGGVSTYPSLRLDPHRRWKVRVTEAPKVRQQHANQQPRPLLLHQRERHSFRSWSVSRRRHQDNGQRRDARGRRSV